MVGQTISQNKVTKSVCYGMAGAVRGLVCFIVGLAYVAALDRAEPPEVWPQFRGPSSAGLAVKQSLLPNSA